MSRSADALWMGKASRRLLSIAEGGRRGERWTAPHVEAKLGLDAVSLVPTCDWSCRTWGLGTDPPIGGSTTPIRALSISWASSLS